MNRRWLRSFFVGLVGAVVIGLVISMLSAATATVTFYYVVNDLGIFGNFPIIFPVRINELAQVIGYGGKSPFEPEQAFLSQNGLITNLGSLGGNRIRPHDLNDAGQVVGMSRTSGDLTNFVPPYTHAFLWQNATMIDLGTYGSDNSSQALGINNSGQVVGSSYQYQGEHFFGSYRSSGQQHAVLWQNGSVTNLGTLPGDNSSLAYNINNNGQIFGWSFNTTTPETKHIFKWENGVMTNLGNLVPLSAYTSNSIWDINNKGQAVGDSYNFGPGIDPKDFKFTAFLWENGTMIDLGNLGGTRTIALDINEAGTVVGHSSTSSNTAHAFVWRDGVMQDLNNLLQPNSGWELYGALGINNNGQIVGVGTFNGQSRAFLLTPVTVTN